MSITKGYGWQLDELASAGRENLDADHVSRYDAKEDAQATGELRLLKELGLNGQSEIVDIGAGTGQFTLAAASACARGRRGRFASHARRSGSQGERVWLVEC